MATHVLSPADDGRSIRATVGDHIVIELPENPTTGYRWTIDAVDDNGLALRDSAYARDDGGAIGGGGSRRLSFTVVRSGLSRIQLKRWREWEGDASVQQRFEVAVDAE